MAATEAGLVARWRQGAQRATRAAALGSPRDRAGSGSAGANGQGAEPRGAGFDWFALCCMPNIAETKRLLPRRLGALILDVAGSPEPRGVSDLGWDCFFTLVRDYYVQRLFTLFLLATKMSFFYPFSAFYVFQKI